jgi:hypothetical protein
MVKKHPVKGCFLFLFSKESLKGKIIQMMIVLLLNTDSESSQILKSISESKYLPQKSGVL